MEPKYLVSIDVKKCIGCGLCSRDCPSRILGIRNGKAELSSQQCIKCGHCVAICPKEAVRISDYDMREIRANDEDVHRIDAEALLDAIRFRRSVRHFRDEEIERVKLEKIIEAGRFTPTARNRQNVRFIVLQNDIPDIENESLKAFRKLIGPAGAVSRLIKLPVDVSKFELKPGFLFFGAPAVILTVSDSEVDASLASTSMELTAEALGLGTVYVGLFTAYANLSVKLRKSLGLGLSEKLVTCLALGYPDVRYCRSAPRKKADVIWR